MQFLKQSTAATVKFGPFVDESDGYTAETGLNISQADVRLSKNGGNFAETYTSIGTAAHDENGWYAIPLDATDVDTLGRLDVAIHESGALPVWREFMVMPANVWDSMFGSDRLQIHVAEMTNDIITAASIALDAIGSNELAGSAATEIADAVLTRDWTSVTGEAARSVLNALRRFRNKVSISGSTMTVTEEDDSTQAWTASITTSAAADPITAVDPD